MDLTTRLLLPAAAAYHAHARHLTVPAVDFRKSFALMSAFTFTVCGVIAVLVLLGFNSMVARYCAPRAAQREQQRGGAVPLERPYKPPAWQEAVCITNPDGTTVYAAPTLKPDSEEEPTVPLQPHPAERALPRMLSGSP